MERLLVTKIKRTSATQAELYGAKHKFADLRLFDLAELQAVGIDPAALPLGEEQPARFWALWEASGKKNRLGNPYRDVVALEPIAGPATTTSAAVGDPEILAELRAIRALLQALASAQGVAAAAEPEPEPEGNSGLDSAFPRYLDNSPVGDNPAELAAYQDHVKATGQAPSSLQGLRNWARGRAQGNGTH